jgi:2-phospho-L-lactate/phosphoenolpyruvate guanylyltransferase
VSTWALVPVKARGEGKQRLSAVLPDSLRAQLVRRMLDDVLGILQRCPQIDGTLVMSPERDALGPATEVLADPAGAMNDALTLALQRLQLRGATCVAIIAADLPRLAAAEVSALVAAGRTRGIAIAPDARGTGTNALCLTLPTDLRLCFGPGSSALHQREAARIGITPATIALPGLEFDVDETADLAALKACALAGYGFLD